MGQRGVDGGPGFAEHGGMSEVRWADQAVQQADERRQIEKSDEEKRQSREAFEQRLQHDRVTKGQQQKQTMLRAQGRVVAEEKTSQATQEESTAQQAKAERDKKGTQKTDKKENKVLAHVRQQAQHGKGLDRNHGALLQHQSAAVQREMDRVAQSSQETSQTLGRKGDESLSANKVQEKSRAKEMDDKDKLKDTETQTTRAENRAEAQQAQNTQGAGQVQGSSGGGAERVEADGRRSGNQTGQQQRQDGPPVDDSSAVKGPSAQAIMRAEKAEMIQKLCEKLLDNYYLGAAPDGSAMMRMELKEGVLAGLIVDVKVDDRRRVKLELSGGNQAAKDLVSASRGELARALGRKGLVLETVDAH